MTGGLEKGRLEARGLPEGGWSPVRALTLVVALVVALVPVQQAVAAGQVEITKIQFDPPGADNGSNNSLNGEYVIIENTGASVSELGRRMRADRVARGEVGFDTGDRETASFDDLVVDLRPLRNVLSFIALAR